MIKCFILRTNNTIKKTRVRESRDVFSFEEGKYFIQSDKVMLYKGLLFFKPFLFYKEGYSEPICFDNVEKVIHKDADGKEINDDTVLIDAQSIHNLTSKELLNVLAKVSLSKFEMLILFVVIINLLISAVVVSMVAQ